MPPKIGKKIIKKVVANSFHFKLYGTYLVSCNLKKFKPVSFLIDGYWIEIPPEAYL